MDNSVLTVSSVYAVLLSILNLSNAAKNQRDVFSNFVQSYFTKIQNAIYYAYLAIYLSGNS